MAAAGPGARRTYGIIPPLTASAPRTVSPAGRRPHPSVAETADGEHRSVGPAGHPLIGATGSLISTRWSTQSSRSGRFAWSFVGGSIRRDAPDNRGVRPAERRIVRCVDCRLRRPAKAGKPDSHPAKRVRPAERRALRRVLKASPRRYRSGVRHRGRTCVLDVTAQINGVRRQAASRASVPQGDGCAPSTVHHGASAP